MNKNLRRNLTIHILSWGIFLCLPLLFYAPGDTLSVNLHRWLRSLGGPLVYMMLFYVNYFVLIPKFYFGHRKTAFYVINIVAVAVATGMIAEWWHLVNQYIPDPAHAAKRAHRPSRPFNPMLFYNAISCFLVVGLSLAVCLSQRWQHIEEARKEAEQSRVEAELSNLRNQLNPHFLLNTLNNIYALISFDTAKAQTAVTDLSRLLRHVLYNSRQNFVPLCKEVEFMTNYIELMRIRVTENVNISNNIRIDPDDATPVAPLIFISLLENAFKHGIAPNGSGFIEITIGQHNGIVTCHIRNSNHPKSQSDKSGSGIGLKQVARRLELLYPGRYTWTRGTTDNDTIYFSKIEIQTNSNPS